MTFLCPWCAAHINACIRTVLFLSSLHMKQKKTKKNRGSINNTTCVTSYMAESGDKDGAKQSQGGGKGV